ncbi:MAG: NAD-dependent epimerase/dehydratase family protein, partial [Candidatus Promineifilaceae bacterium]
MNILVTGGAGYIGSITTEQLILRGYQVVVFDNLYQGHREAVHPEATFVEGDLNDRHVLAEVFTQHKIDAIMHFASYTLVGESVQKPFLYLGDNVRNGLNLLQAASDHGVSKFILSSTANLFDDPERIP